jgi:hypothetical protein
MVMRGKDQRDSRTPTSFDTDCHISLPMPVREREKTQMVIDHTQYEVHSSSTERYGKCFHRPATGYRKLVILVAVAGWAMIPGPSHCCSKTLHKFRQDGVFSALILWQAGERVGRGSGQLGPAVIVASGRVPQISQTVESGFNGWDDRGQLAASPAVILQTSPNRAVPRASRRLQSARFSLQMATWQGFAF